jgi:hypothetical protein
MSERTYKQAYDDGDTEVDPESLYICRVCDRPYKGRAINGHMVNKHGYVWYDQFNVTEPEVAATDKKGSNT